MTRLCRFMVVCVCAGSMAVLASCGRPSRPPNVLLIVVDTLRADRLGAYGNRRGLTPFLDELAKRGTVFTNAYAPSSWTCPSVASLLTSRYATQHGVVAFESKLADEEVTVAEALAPLGYLAGGFSANFRLTKQYGYAQGFEQWRVYLNQGRGPRKPRGDLLRRDATNWVRTVQQRTPGRPVLLYLQYMEPHSPYEPAEPYRSRFRRNGNDAVDEGGATAKLLKLIGGSKNLSAAEIDLLESLYDGEVASVDEEIRLLFGELEKTGFLHHAVVIITADHGEEFNEHGQVLHGITLYNTAIRVPLIISAPGYRGGQVVPQNVSLIDLAPTLLELVGLAREPRFEGRSLVPLMTPGSVIRALRAKFFSGDRRNTPESTISELESSGAWDLRVHSHAIVRGSQKLIVRRQGGRELYDVMQDPGETHSLQRSARVQSARLFRALEETRAVLKTRARGSVETVPLDEATKERLRALGYQP